MKIHSRFNLRATLHARQADYPALRARVAPEPPAVTILLRPPARILERHELPSDEALLATQCGGVFGGRTRGSA